MSKSPQARQAAEPEPHLKRLQTLAAAADAVCLDTVWHGCTALYRFRCAQGHEWSHGARRLPGCPVCIKAATASGKRLKDGLQRLRKAAQERGGVCLSETYLGQAFHHRFRCAEGHEWESTDVLRGAWCRSCAHARKKTQYRLADGLARLQQAAADKGGLCLSEVYEGSKEPYRFRCAQNHEWQAPGARVLRGAWCLACAKAQSRWSVRPPAASLLLDGLLRLQKVALDKGGVCLSESYLGQCRRYRFQCGHGHEWEATAASVLQGSWCPNCACVARRLGIDVARADAQARGGQCLSTTYVDNNTKMSWMCDRGHVWQARFGQIRKGQWCPECAHMARITNANSKARARYRAAGNLAEVGMAQANDSPPQQPQHRA